MRSSIPAAATVGEIARNLDEPVHRIKYVIRSRGIQAVSRAGNACIYADADVQNIASELRRIDEEKGVTK